jgi:hypothetical protein
MKQRVGSLQREQRLTKPLAKLTKTNREMTLFNKIIDGKW